MHGDIWKATRNQARHTSAAQNKAQEGKRVATLPHRSTRNRQTRDGNGDKSKKQATQGRKGPPSPLETNLLHDAVELHEVSLSNRLREGEVWP